MKTKEAIGILNQMQSQYSYIRHNDDEFLALEASKEVLREKAEREKGCEYCTDGNTNTFGEETFKDLECKNRTNVYYEKPFIFKTNGMYFFIVDKFTPIRIHACPICGRKLKEDGK